MSVKKFAVGDVLFYVDERGNRREPLTIERVGKQWYSVSQYGRPSQMRVWIETLTVRSREFTHGRCYASEEDYLDSKRLESEWRNFCDQIGRTYHAPASVEAIREAAKLLGLSLGEEVV